MRFYVRVGASRQQGKILERIIMTLYAVRDLANKINRHEKYLDGLRAALTSTTRRLDGMPRAQSLDSKIERLTQKIIDGESELIDLKNSQADNALALSLEIYNRIKNQNAAQILCLRYVHCLPFKDIIAEMKYSDASIYKLHKSGVEEFNSYDSIPEC